MSRAPCWLQVCAGSALLIGSAARVEAWDLLHRSHGDCAAQTVQLPAQKVTVETAAPRVVVQETRPTRLVNAGFAPPMVASFFVPAPVNMGMVGFNTAPPDDSESVKLDFAALRAAHDLERCHARAMAMKAIHEAQSEKVGAVLNRVNESLQRSAAPQDGVKAPPPKAGAGSSDKCCDDLMKELKKLDDRLTTLEGVVKWHDDAIRNKPGVVIPKLDK